MDIMERIDKAVKENPVIIFMKGTPQLPSCGFSSRAADALNRTELGYSYVNILEDPEIFENLPRYADWPTFPQVYVDGELIGGCDIVQAMHESNELESLLNKEGALGEGNISAA